ncbi:MAG: GNAT family N-acetyltransferase [Promethearchaeota archaeon]
MIELQKMTVDEFDSIMEKTFLRYISEIDTYREEIKKDKGVLPKEFAEKQWSQMLSEGINTENNYFWTIRKSDSDEIIGQLYLLQRPEKDQTFIVDIFLKKEYRGTGYGTFVLKFVEKFAKIERASKTIELHVFKHNPGAIKLYERNGFEQIAEDYTGFRMLKKI